MADTDKEDDKTGAATPRAEGPSEGQPTADSIDNKPPSARAEAAKLDLPQVESPSVSPAEPEKVVDPEPVLSASEPLAPQARPLHPSILSFQLPAMSALTPRRKRHALLAASVMLAAAIGAVAGAMTVMPGAPKPDTAAIAERHALQQQVAQLSREIGTLKTNIDQSSKAAKQQIAKLNDKLTSERLARESAEVTGSIASPSTVPAAAAPVAVAVTPLPTPRPRLAEAEPARPLIVQGWTIHDVRDGYVYVQGQGDVYQVVPGAPLPGLGAVESIKRQDGRWVVVTPKGLIVASRDRRRSEAF